MNLHIRSRQQAYFLVTSVLLIVALGAFGQGHRGIAALGFLLLPGLVVASRFECIVFNGDRLYRTGIFARIEALLTRKPLSISVDEIEMITTESTRLRYRSDRVRYRYRTFVVGGEAEFFLHSNDRGYSSLVRKLFEAAGECKLDTRSSELLHYLDLSTVLDLDVPSDRLANLPPQLLRGIANSLRLAGRMRQALNYFTLAYQRDPRNPQLLYEMGRFLRSLAAIEDPRLLNRSGACLRLAARISHNEPLLLERIGETYFERLEYDRASRCFSRAIELDPKLFRAHVGLAEIALRSGKLAHVAHYYRAAANSSEDEAQFRHAMKQADYYGRLCSDEEYLEAEINRITMLRNLRGMRNSALIVFFVAGGIAIIASRSLSLLAEMSWSVMLSSGLVWLGTVGCMHWNSKRRHASAASS